MNKRQEIFLNQWKLDLSKGGIEIPEIEGSPKQKCWARRLRDEFMYAILRSPNTSEGDKVRALGIWAKERRAGFWIGFRGRMGKAVTAIYLAG